MSQWLKNALIRAETIDDSLSVKRQASLELLKHADWPSRKVEAWRYTSVAALENKTFTTNNSSNDNAYTDVIEGLDSLDLLFIDGDLKTDLSKLSIPEGLTITLLSDNSGPKEDSVASIFSTIKPMHHIFGLVNDVLAINGLLIDVAEGVEIKQPLRIINIFSQDVEAHTRVLVRLSANAGLSVIEEFVGDLSSFNTSFAEYEVSASASLEHYRFSLQTGCSLSIGGCHFKLAENADLNSTLVGFGSDLSRLDIDVIHDGQHTQAKMNAIYLLDGEEQFDLHTTIEHATPNGTTEENVRGIVADKSRATFNGRIHIHRDAQKTLAELNNRNLLLSRQAEINTKPELEIYADDVRCAHGATIAETDKSALYYLQSRGIDRGHAQVILNFGFINELVDQMPNQTLADWLRPQLRARFENMDIE